jgi:hypothetical protein
MQATVTRTQTNKIVYCKKTFFHAKTARNLISFTKVLFSSLVKFFLPVTLDV